MRFWVDKSTWTNNDIGDYIIGYDFNCDDFGTTIRKEPPFMCLYTRYKTKKEARKALKKDKIAMRKKLQCV